MVMGIWNRRETMHNTVIRSSMIWHHHTSNTIIIIIIRGFHPHQSLENHHPRRKIIDLERWFTTIPIFREEKLDSQHCYHLLLVVENKSNRLRTNAFHQQAW